MEYADVIWDNQKQNLINKLENIQLDAARIVTGGTRLTSHDSLYKETKWEKLKDRRNNHKLVLFHKMNYNKTPQYLVEVSHVISDLTTSNIIMDWNFSVFSVDKRFK
jgi:hypothetical protein